MQLLRRQPRLHLALRRGVGRARWSTASRPIVAETGQTGFHFVDEAAPPKSLKALAAELQRRGVAITWWGNIRFEKTFTPSCAELLADSGCIAISGGLEVASDRLLTLMKKGRIVAQGNKDQLLAGAKHTSSLVTALDNEQLASALTAKGISFAPAGTGLRVEAVPVDVGRVVAENGIVITDLRAGDGGLEDLFLELTGDTQRDAADSAMPAADGATA